MAFVGGYTVFLPGRWNVADFLFSYAMIGIVPALFLVWKVLHRTKVIDNGFSVLILLNLLSKVEEVGTHQVL
jgi:yeast amino acid transporter